MTARWRGVGGLLTLGLGFGLAGAEAHQELYHNVDLDLRELDETGVAEVTFIIHAPELLVGSAEAADATSDARWLQGRTGEELQRLVTLGQAFLAKRFTLRLDHGQIVDLAAEARFEDFASMRAGSERGLPPACIRATVELAAPPEVQELRIDHAADSGKRLVLVVHRSKTFPGVLDIEPGTGVTVTLREESTNTSEETAVAPNSSKAEKTTREGYVTLIVLVLVAGGVFLAGRIWSRRPR